MPECPTCKIPMIACRCEQNAVCPECYYGWGSDPCECSKTISDTTHNKLLEESMKRYAGIWEVLSDV